MSSPAIDSVLCSVRFSSESTYSPSVGVFPMAGVSGYFFTKFPSSSYSNTQRLLILFITPPDVRVLPLSTGIRGLNFTVPLMTLSPSPITPPPYSKSSLQEAVQRSSTHKNMYVKKLRFISSVIFSSMFLY